MFVERFLKEYGNYKKKSLYRNCVDKRDARLRAAVIDNVIRKRRNGIITTDDAMREIMFL